MAGHVLVAVQQHTASAFFSIVLLLLFHILRPLLVMNHTRTVIDQYQLILRHGMSDVERTRAG